MAGEDAATHDRAARLPRPAAWYSPAKAMVGSAHTTRKTGKVLWSFFAGAGVNAPPASYSVDGKQYIVVGAGGNTTIGSKRGNNIIAFTF